MGQTVKSKAVNLADLASRTVSWIADPIARAKTREEAARLASESAVRIAA